ncbi:MAG TPA: hypothetical protein VHK24_13135 [Steroidobacter sp.]|jgi:hypothetical protein|nr:hypothetical protein [Steroidobacter sp.]
MTHVRTLVLAAVALLAGACAAAPATPAKSQPPNLSGRWMLTTESSVGAEDSEMLVKQTGNSIMGALSTESGSVDYTGTVDGENVAFGFMVNAPGSDLRIDYSGVVQGDTMKGKVVFGAFGEGAFIAKRK